MLRSVSLKTVVRFLVIAGMTCSAFAQEEGAGGGHDAGAPLAFKVEWVRPASQENAKVRYMPTQENVADPNVEIKYYGAAKQILTTGAPGNPLAPYGVWSGTATAPFAVTFKMKNSYVDLTGFGNIKWFTKTSAFHVVRPVIKLANGTMLVGDATFASVTMVTENRFALSTVRWIKLDPEKIVTLNSGRAAANPNGDVWAPNPDLSKVDEVGFVDLMPGSGHGTGGWIQLGTMEVYGKPVPRTAAQ